METTETLKQKLADQRMQDYSKIVAQIVNNRQLSKIGRYTYNTEIDLMQLVRRLGKELCNNFKIDADNEFCYTNTLRWLFGHQFWAINPDTHEAAPGDHTRGLFIAGPTGSGKSMLLAILSHLAGFFRIEYEFNSEKRLLCWNPHRADELCNKFMLEGAEVASAAKRANVLCINDMGIEHQEQLYMGNRIGLIRQIIEARGDMAGQFTLISSNYPINHDKILEMYGDRVVSRLQGMCNYFELNGGDRRKQ